MCGGDVEDARTKCAAALYRRTRKRPKKTPAWKDPTVNHKRPIVPVQRATLAPIALSRSSGPGIGNGGRSVTSRSSPSLSGEEHHMAHVSSSVRDFSFQSANFAWWAPHGALPTTLRGGWNREERANCVVAIGSCQATNPPWPRSVGGPTRDRRGFAPPHHMRLGRFPVLPQCLPRASVRGTDYELKAGRKTMQAGSERPS